MGGSLPRQLNDLRKEGTVAGVPDPMELGLLISEGSSGVLLSFFLPRFLH